MHPVLPLWPKTAPYADASPDQAQPSIKAFEVPGAAAAVVICPGGGYTFKAPHEGDPIAERLNAGGISAFVLDYRVCPCHPMAPLTDALRAIRRVRAMGYSSVGILGFSAGGHLTCSAATHYAPGDPQAEDPIERLSSRPDFFVPCYPVVSFDPRITHLGSRRSLLRESDTPALADFFTTENNVSPNTPPAFIWHTADDEAVPVENSLALAGALSRNGVTFELHIYPHGAHGLGLGDACTSPAVHGWAELCINFINTLCSHQ